MKSLHKILENLKKTHTHKHSLLHTCEIIISKIETNRETKWSAVWKVLIVVKWTSDLISSLGKKKLIEIDWRWREIFKNLNTFKLVEWDQKSIHHSTKSIRCLCGGDGGGGRDGDDGGAIESQASSKSIHFMSRTSKILIQYLRWKEKKWV